MTHSVAGSPSLPIDVVIPAYNRQQLIARAVSSAVLQEPPPARVIVVDDGSNDSTAEEALRCGAEVIRTANGGEGAARNVGLRASTSSHVAFLDSDDEWLPGHLATLFDARGKHVLVGSRARATPSGRLVGHVSEKPLALTGPRLFWPDSPVLPSAVMVTRVDALAVGGFSALPLAADLEFWARLLDRGTGVAVPEVTVLYHEHLGQISRDTEPMRQARHDVLCAFEGRSWWKADMVSRQDMLGDWDRWREGEAGVGSRLVGTFLHRPRLLIALSEALVDRRKHRQSG